MYRGTTPTLSLKLETDISLNDLAELWATFKTSTTEVTKTLSEVEIDDSQKIVTVQLSQEDTLKLYGYECQVQVRFRTQSDLAYATTIASVDVGQILKNGVI